MGIASILPGQWRGTGKGDVVSDVEPNGAVGAGKKLGSNEQ